MKKIAVILSGCGNKDGSEITEAVSLIVNLTQAGAALTYFAPNLEFTPTNFLTNKTSGEKRNVMAESARITRSQINEIGALVALDFDGVAFVGGMGAATHLSDWATQGASGEVLSEVKNLILDFHAQSKPIAAICISPVLIAKVLGPQGVTVTLGNDKETIQEVLKTGAKHEVCPVDDFVTDREFKVITTPAYMYSGAQPFEVFKGIAAMTREFIEMA